MLPYYIALRRFAAVPAQLYFLRRSALFCGVLRRRPDDKVKAGHRPRRQNRPAASARHGRSNFD
jgi:hypothetical protein